MSEMNLLNINVDALFEQYSVVQISQVQKMLEMEVEKKREELRTMVGERYRDLLKAADTIAVMKVTSSSLIDHVNNIAVNLKNLNEKQLVGFKTDPQLPSHSNRKLGDFYSTVVQIKLLTEMPELIWASIDDEQFTVATELFIFARHISTGLQLDTSNKYLQHLPVAKKQWEIVKPFYFTIKQRCLSVLEREHLTAEIATDCLLSLFLLEKTTLDQLFAMFVHLRSKAFLTALSNDHSVQKRVKERILASLEVLNSTVQLIYRIFFENEKGRLRQMLEDFTKDTKTPTIFLVNLDDQSLSTVLPDIVAKFKPAFDLSVLSVGAVKITIEKWMEIVGKEAKTQLRKLFELVSSMKTIQEIKKDSRTIRKNSNWSEMCENLSLSRDLNFYEQEYQPLLNERTRDIVRQSWTKCVDEIFDEVKEMLEHSRRQTEESSIFWTENSEDNPLSLKNVLSQDKKTNVLLMKTKGFSPEIVKICSSFDDRLGTIFSEVNVFLEDEGGKLVEKQNLVEYLKDTCQEHISELITKIKSLDFERRCKELVLLGRLFVSFYELCPNFKLCLTYTYTASSWEKISVDKKNLEKWNRVCNLLEDESFEFWKQFCDVFLKELPIDEAISKTLGHEAILKDFVNWETLSVEEKDEQDNPVQSTIRIPSQPRISVQMYLVKIIEKLNKWVPQTLPLKVLLYLVAELINTIITHYKLITGDKFVASNQHMALQLYFDLKFLQLLFVDRDNKTHLDEMQKLTSELKSFVDPFDFELFYSYINNNVKKCAQRMQYEFGVLLPYPENIGMLSDSKQSAGTLDKDPNVLCLSSNGSSSNWFPLLPIVAPDNKNPPLIQDVEKIPSTKTKKSESKLATSQQIAQNYASNVKSGAAAFFGAMSQDWFR